MIAVRWEVQRLDRWEAWTSFHESPTWTLLGTRRGSSQQGGFGMVRLFSQLSTGGHSVTSVPWPQKLAHLQEEGIRPPPNDQGKSLKERSLDPSLGNTTCHIVTWEDKKMRSAVKSANHGLGPSPACHHVHKQRFGRAQHGIHLCVDVAALTPQWQAMA